MLQMDFLRNRLPNTIFEKLLQNNYVQKNCLKSLLLLNEVNLKQNTDLSSEEIKTLIKQVRLHFIETKLKTAFDSREWPRISTGCQCIDAITNRGIPVNGINEIFGSSGVGKTQLCLQLSLMVQLPLDFGGLGKGVVYISTEDIFPSKRLHQLASYFKSKYNLLEFCFEDNIYLKHISDYEQLRRCLFVNLPIFLEQHSIGLIVIDSIAGLFRSENIDTSYVNRSQEFIAATTKLNQFVDQFGLCVLCTNQVTNNINTQEDDPCLGLAWSNLLTCRFNIVRRHDDKVREFNVVFAPDLQNSKARFIITDEGLKGINNS